MSPSDPSSTTMERQASQTEEVKKGWLDKKGEYIPTWRKRFFILYSNGRFSGFKNAPTGNETVGAEKQNNFTVEGCQIITMNSPRPFTFIIRGLQVLLRQYT